ncbi:MAG: phage holin family protein [Flavobacteriaceae bacterium]|nr:phage holin family protein [Flavobacteriaceae bacterium]
MKIIIKILFTALSVIALAHFLPGVRLAKPESAIYVAIALGLLRVTVRPLLIFFTLPATIVSLGLFLFVINAIIILIADYFIDGFAVSGFWIALLFSILLSFLQSVLYSFLKDKKK